MKKTTVEKCNIKNMKKWISALRSGKYKQCRNALGKMRAKQESYCCLGVACDVAIKNKIKIKKTYEEENVNGRTVTTIAFDAEQASLPIKVRNWLGLANQDPYLADPTRPEPMTEPADQASVWNDGHRANFLKIADLLENTFIPKKVKKNAVR